MKTIALTLLAAALGFAQSQTQTPASKKAAKAASPAQTSGTARRKPIPAPKLSPEQQAQAQPQTQAIPAGAKLVEPNLYRYTDSSGKTWNYRQTPFGISKGEETAVPASQPASQSTPQAQAKTDPVAVTDLGDSYRFEKKTPFGASTWVRKKSELTDEEKALAAGRQTQSNPNPTSVISKPAGNQ